MNKLLFTGGTGFLGKNVMPLLQKEYQVTTCGITPEDMIQANLAVSAPELPQQYDIVLHAAGKAHVVPKTEEERPSLAIMEASSTMKSVCLERLTLSEKESVSVMDFCR